MSRLCLFIFMPAAHCGWPIRKEGHTCAGTMHLRGSAVVWLMQMLNTACSSSKRLTQLFADMPCMKHNKCCRSGQVKCRAAHLNAGNDVADLLAVRGGGWGHDDLCTACHVLAHLQGTCLYCRTCRVALAVHHKQILHWPICLSAPHHRHIQTASVLGSERAD